MSIIVKIDNIDLLAWDGLVKTSPVATWFQTQEAYSFFDNLPFLEAFALGVVNDRRLKGVIVGYIQKDGGKLKSFLSRRAIVLGGPLLADTITEAELTTLLKSVCQHVKKRAIYLEMRNFNDYGPWKKCFEAAGFVYEPHYDIIVDTSTMERVNDNLGKSRKRDIRVSFRDGATMVTKPTLDQIKDYYLILSDLYKNKVKTPLFPLAFFESLYLLPSSVFLLVDYNGQIVGGTVCVGLQNKALYEMYACGKDGIYKNIFPSEMATFSGLQYSRKWLFAF